MSLVCVFHDRAEFRHAEAIAEIVQSAGHTPWLANRDAHVDWRTEVEMALTRSDCMGSIVIWSLTSTVNRIVVEEAEATLNAGRKLLGLVLGTARPPIGLRNTPRILLPDWDGSSEDEATMSLIREKLAGRTRNEAKSTTRIDEIVLEGRTLQRPTFVFSVSSFETQISPAHTLELLNLFTPQAVLVSAYDVLGTRDDSPEITPTPEMLRDLEAKDTVIFLDSGNYEAYRLGDAFWQRNPWVLREATGRLRCDVIFSHDRLIEVNHIGEHKPAELARRIIQEVERDVQATGRNAISPIVHAPRLKDGRFAAELLPELCALIVRYRRPPLVAVAERELGDGILARAKRVYSIRRALDRLGFKQPLHILGTGNPLSMMILALAGGDVFDGLEWCRTVVDASTMRLHHFHHFDLFVAQRSLIEDELLREYLESRDELLTAKAKAVLHNLYFFQRFVDELRTAHQQDSFEELFDRYLPGEYGRIMRRIKAKDVG
jgi:queuine/archaeosine tRNA-ribosyltransferase